MLVELMMFFELFCCRFEEFARGSDWNILGGSNLCSNITWCYNKFLGRRGSPTKVEKSIYRGLHYPSSVWLQVSDMGEVDEHSQFIWYPVGILRQISWYEDWTLLVSGSHWIGISSIYYFNNIVLLCLHNRIPRGYSPWISVRYEIYCDLITWWESAVKVIWAQVS